MSILSVDHICKSFTKEKNALLNINMAVGNGEIVALLGESGSGKTTLLRIIAGFEVPDSGSIKLNSQDITYKKPEKRNIGMIFQDYALFPHLTVFENIKFGIHHSNKAQIQREVETLIALLKIEDLQKRYPHQISGGQQQRVAIARSLAAKPELLMLDEPFSNLDKSLKDSVRKEIRSLLKITNTNAIFVTHDIEDAIAVADKIVVLKDGEILQQASYFDLYFHPVNVYVAEICSPIQKLNFKNKAIYFRPQAIKYTSEDTDFQAMVLQNTFVGMYYEVNCKVGEEQFYFYHHEAISTGKIISLVMDEKLKWEF